MWSNHALGQCAAAVTFGPLPKIKDPTGGLTNIRGNVYLALWDTFKENNISIPFPQREVLMLDNSKLDVSRNRKSGVNDPQS